MTSKTTGRSSKECTRSPFPMISSISFVLGLLVSLGLVFYIPVSTYTYLPYASQSSTTSGHSSPSGTSIHSRSSTQGAPVLSTYTYSPDVVSKSTPFNITYQDHLPILPTDLPRLHPHIKTIRKPFTSILDVSPHSNRHPYYDYASIASTDYAAKQEAVKREMQHAYGGFEVHAWGSDELRPVSQKPEHTYRAALSVIDSLDTLKLMGLEDQYRRGVEYIRDYFVVGPQTEVNLFETTIRVVGGLLSAFTLSPQDTVLAETARDFVNACLMAFETPTKLPFSTMTLHTQRKSNPHGSSVSEMGTLQMEYQYLSRLTGNGKYKQLVNDITKVLHAHQTPLFTQFMNPMTNQFIDTTITFGARVDSTYEYFLKQWLLSGKHPGMNHVLQMYRESIRAMGDQLLLQSYPRNYTFVAEKHNGVLHGKMDHLVCFLPATLALGVREGAVVGEEADMHIQWAKELTRTCHAMYTTTRTGVAPEIVQFSVNIDSTNKREGNYNRNGIRNTKGHFADFIVDPHATHNILRPEALEAMYELYKLTKDNVYRDMAWDVFLAWVKYCRISTGGYSGLHNVNVANMNLDYLKTDHTGKINNKVYIWDNWNDKQESFFLAESLKYLYLIFSENDPLEHGYVLNTEAHPLPIDKGNSKPVISTLSSK